MRVSCILVTYNRPPRFQFLVEEAVESFLRQDYPDRELVLLNDCPAQHLVCDAPAVVVVNVTRRFRTLGEKRNAAIALADGDALLPWDDDDIMLPWRISASVERLAGAGYYNPSRFWFLDPVGLHRDHVQGLAHGCSIFTRSAFDAVGGYPHISLGEDLGLDAAFRARPDVEIVEGPELAPRDWFYVYRWGVSPVHMSGRSDARWYADIGRRPVTPGCYSLRPHWGQDYVTRTRDALPTDDQRYEPG